MMMVKCRVRPSVIHGLGLFATERIEYGTTVWEYDDNVDYRIPLDDPRLKTDNWKKHAEVHGYSPKGENYVEFPGDHAMFINHSFSPNIACPNGEGMEALRVIEAGEEILSDYCEFDEYPESGGTLH